MSKSKIPYENEHFVDSSLPVWNYSFFQKEDLVNYRHGAHHKLYELMGSHAINVLKTDGYYFAVWAPNATYVSVIGDFNNWDEKAHPLFVRLDKSGIWEGFIPNLPEHSRYKYFIKGYENKELYKGDPFSRNWELRPQSASVTRNVQYQWNDERWMRNRKKYNSLKSPWSVYEVHLGSWIKPDDEESFYTYQQIQEKLVPYVKDMGFTHVEFMPVMEFPYDASWGYQGTGYFAPTSRFGSPEEFMELIDVLHQNEIGVILDWVPSHFPSDAHGLYQFDGNHTYEYADPKKGFHPDWNSYIFNYGRGEVRSFLLSNAHYWFELYHIDGIRVDAVSSLVQLDYSRGKGEWDPNILGGNENLEAVSLVQNLNEMIYRDFPDVQTIAEESANFPKVTGLTTKGGLGFGMKWMMGWMHDTLEYFKTDPYYRKDQQDKFTFSMLYFSNENYMLPLSHDEVVHGKSPMIYKMPGTESQRFANLRLLYSYMYSHPGTKLLFMGGEFGQTAEWNFAKELDWNLLKFDFHRKLQYCVKRLNDFYKELPAFHQMQFDPKGFEWIDLNHREECIITYKRKARFRKDDVVIILNNTPVTREWEIALTGKNEWNKIFCSDDEIYGGSGLYDHQKIKTIPVPGKNKLFKVKLMLPGLSATFLQ